MLDISTVLNSINASETIYPFRPVRCEEKALEGREPVEGFLYFTTDTKKIFQVVDGKYVPMGGNSGIYYGQRYFSEEETDTEQTIFAFTMEEIEGNNIPNKDDLILNIPDGNFYRIIDVHEGEISGERLTVAGSGGGGGSTGGGISKPVINDTERDTRYFVTTDTSNMKISFTCSTQSPENNYIGTITYSFGQEQIIEDVSYNFGEVIYFDISKYLNKFSTSTRNTIQIQVTDAYGNNSTKKNFYFYLVELTLNSTFNSISTITGNIVTYRYTPNGGTGLNSKYVEVILAPINNIDEVVYSHQEPIVNVNTNYTLPINITEFGEPLAHGVYLLTAQFKGIIPNTTRVISSNKLSAQLVYYDDEINTPLIATNFQDMNIQQYSKFNLQYLIADKANVTEAEVTIMLLGDNAFEYSTTEVATLNAINEWNYTFVTTGSYDLRIKYGTMPAQNLGRINVQAYVGEVPTVDTSRAELYLTSAGRSNSQANKDQWTWVDPLDRTQTYSAVFENFLWGTENGWIEDEDGMALKLTNGAKVSIPNYHPFASTKSEATVNGLTIELDFKLSGVRDYTKPLIQCLAYNGTEIEAGFSINGQKATLNSSVIKATTQIIGGEEDESGKINETDIGLQSFTQYFNEDTRIHLTYVIQAVPTTVPINTFYFVYTYLNGVLSGIKELGVTDPREVFRDRNGTAYITIDSEFGDVFIYNLRVYRSELDMRTIINNYIADITDIDKKIALYKDNNIFDAAGNISLTAIRDLSYTLGVPYVLLKGGSKMNKKKTDAITYTQDLTYQLPVAKDDYRLMSMAMYDGNNETPVMNIPILLEDEAGKQINDFNNIALNTTYKPKRGVQVYGQGTSSMIYPTKNLRLRFIQEEDYPVVYEGSYPVEIVCFKADYMDSSSSHNTATGNLVYDLYTALNLKTPAQQFKADNPGKEGVAEYDLVTAIKGFPIVCFYTEGNSDNYTYIGRYNFNLDKATPEPFGFPPQWFYTGETTTDEQGRERKVVKAVGLKVEKVNGYTVLPLDEEGKEIERDIVQCWEMLNNDDGPPKFLWPEGVVANDFASALKVIKDGAEVWTGYYEDRYPDVMAGIGKGEDKAEDEWPDYEEDLQNGIFRVASWLNSTATSEASNLPLEEGKYYQTRDIEYNPEKTYYSSPGVEKIITVSDKVTTFTEDDVLPIVNIEIFKEKVNNKYNSYTVSYVEGQWTISYIVNENYEEINGINMEEYGISWVPNKAPVEGMSFVIDYLAVNDWNSSLLEYYTIDNVDYRLAKFTSEFEDYFNKDFATFYYILTLTLLMMDSRAKNMMLASWDQIIWYPIFYDMDTMLGVNNTGFNKFSFETEDDPQDKVFNGFGSPLWDNYRICFPKDIAEFYDRMRSAGLSFEKLLSIYNGNSADKWNEALTSADASYKYERPFEEGYYDGKEGEEIGPGSVNYLYAAQGKRSNHRSWWINNRLKYLDTKFLPRTYGDKKPSTTNAFTFRAYALPEQKSTPEALECVAQVKPNHKFDLTVLNTCYPALFIGGIVYDTNGEYIESNRTVTIGPEGVRHEVESYILNADMLSDIGDLSNKYLGSFTFPTMTRLTKLKFGRSRRSDPNSYDKYYNNLLTTLGIGNTCPFLEELNVANCTGLNDINLSQCTRLQKVDAEGSSLKRISFPKDSILREIYLPSGLSSLFLENQPYLTTLESPNASSITEIVLDNVSGLDSYSLVKQVMSNTDIMAKDFYLTNINWTITEPQINTVNGELEGLDILEALLSEKVQGYNGRTKAQSLTGTITINIPNCKIDAYKIYEKYVKEFPNVTFVYGENITDLDPAVTVTFMSDDTENAGVHYRVLASGEEDGIKLGVLVSTSGPTGIALTAPSKADTEEFTYNFTGYWVEKNSKIKYYIDSIVEPEENTLPLNEVIPTNDLIFIPQFEEITARFAVVFRDSDGNIIHQNGEEAYYVPYGEKYDGPIKNYYYKDDSNLDLYQRWAFKGWSRQQYGTSEVIGAEYEDVTNMVITARKTLYAHFLIEDVREVATKEEYFNFTWINDSTYGSGYSISVKPEYGESLQGKITLPNKYNNTPIIRLGRFTHSIETGKQTYNASGIIVPETKYTSINFTHLFFLDSEESYYKIVEDSAFHTPISTFYKTVMGSEGESYYFRPTNILEEVHLPESIEVIGDRSFYECSALSYAPIINVKELKPFAFSNCKNLRLTELPETLLIMGVSAFQNGGSDIQILDLPKNLQTIGNYSFSGCVNVKVSEFGGDGSQLNSIGEYAFGNGCGNGIVGPTVETLTIYGNHIYIGTNCFKDGYNRVIKLALKGNAADYEDGFIDRIMNRSISEVDYFQE